MRTGQKHYRKAGAIIPLSPSARAFVGEAAALSRILKQPIEYFFAGEDTASTRNTVLSLFPDGSAPPRRNLTVVDVEPQELIEQAVLEKKIDFLVIGPVQHESQGGFLSTARLETTLQSLPCTLLLLKKCNENGTRFRRLVCSIQLDELSYRLLEFVNDFRHLFYPDRLHVVRELPWEAPGTGESSEHGNVEMEAALLREFVPESIAKNPACIFDTVTGKRGEGVLDYVSCHGADLLLLSRSSGETALWERLADRGDPGAILIYRPQNP